MDNLLVSINCITYNHVDYIRQCLDGFMMQKCNFDFEVLIHDDASTDNTANIIKEFQEKYPNIIKPIFQIENQWSKGIRGIGAIHNISRAKGKYIAMCEGDDYWTDPYKLQKQVDFLEVNENYIACFHNAWIENSIENKVYEYHPWKESRAISSKEVIEIGGYIFPTAALVFRSSAEIRVFKKCSAGDLSLSLDLLAQGKFYFLSDYMSVYRRHENGVYSGLINDDKKILKFEESVIYLLEEKKKMFSNENNIYFKNVIKTKYNKLFYKYNYPFYKIIKAVKYYSLREVLRLLKFKIRNG